MKRYAYKAMNPEGRSIEGVIEADGRSEVDRFFLDKELTPLKVAEVRSGGPGEVFADFLFMLRRKLLENDLIAFTRQFAAAYGAGLAVPRILSMLAKQMSHKLFRTALGSISDQIQTGKGLTEAFSQFPKFFDTTYLAILQSGEVSGNLDTVMNYSAGLLEKKMIHRERIKSVLLYPKLVVGAIVFTVIIMLIFVIPQFQKLYDRFGSQLPLPTRILVGISHVTQSYWWAAAIGAPLGFLFLRYLKSNEAFMLWFHRQVLRSPIFGPLMLKVELTHFSTTFALLLRSGIRVTVACDIAIRGMRNSYMRHKMVTIIPYLEQGGTLSAALEKVDVIPLLMTSMVSVGEESGNLDSLLERVAFLYEQDTDMILKRLPTMLEPVILGILFFLVLGLAIAVYMPMWKLSSLVKGG